jgi:hypothetical protein
VSEGSGGGSWAAASQTAAAVRTARSRATPAPTPVATAQLRASTKEERRSAATFGGVDPRSAFQMGSRMRCVASAARAPKPTVTAFQPYFFTISTLVFYPDSPPEYTCGDSRQRTGRSSGVCGKTPSSRAASSRSSSWRPRQSISPSNERVTGRDVGRLDTIRAMNNPAHPTTVTHWLTPQP